LLRPLVAVVTLGVLSGLWQLVRPRVVDVLARSSLGCPVRTALVADALRRRYPDSPIATTSQWFSHYRDANGAGALGLVIASESPAWDSGHAATRSPSQMELRQRRGYIRRRVRHSSVWRCWPRDLLANGETG